MLLGGIPDSLAPVCEPELGFRERLAESGVAPR
jgi:hypothetical protein